MSCSARIAAFVGLCWLAVFFAAALTGISREAHGATPHRDKPVPIDIPWPCWAVRKYVATHTAAEVEQFAQENNLNKLQRATARACLKVDA